jgi:hypothetical protein
MAIARLAGLMGSAVIDLTLGIGVLAYSTWYSVVAVTRVLGGTPAQMALRGVVAGAAYGGAFSATLVTALVVWVGLA